MRAITQSYVAFLHLHGQRASRGHHRYEVLSTATAMSQHAVATTKNTTSSGARVRTSYDAERRPVVRRERLADGSERTIERMIYGEELPVDTVPRGPDGPNPVQEEHMPRGVLEAGTARVGLRDALRGRERRQVSADRRAIARHERDLIPLR